MKRKHKVRASMLLACMLVFVLAASACASADGASAEAPDYSDLEPIRFTMTYNDNPTFPFNQDWMPINKVQELFNAEIEFQVYPISEYNSKVALSLNTGTPSDVMMRIDASVTPFSEFTANGAFVPISDYFDWTPNLKRLLESNNLMDQVPNVSSKDGKLYHMPRISDKPIYNGGPLIRVDLLEKFGLERPKTYEELYEVAKVFKEHYPNSYPVTNYVDVKELFPATMPGFGISLGALADTGSWVLSYDLEKKEYFAGAISDNLKAYVTYFNKLYAEGLLDPEFNRNASDQWTSKLATDISMISWCAYDMIGGIEANASDPNCDYDMLIPLEGPAGARAASRPLLGDGIAISARVIERPDFERLVRTVDSMFYSPEATWLFSRGAEGETYELVDGEFKFMDNLLNDPNGLFKALQAGYGIGIYNFQMLWEREFELTKKDPNYTVINDIVIDMPNSMPPTPPLAKFDSDTAEEVGMLQAPLADAFEIWVINFITGSKSIENEWDTYVAEMESKGIQKLLEMYRENLPE